MPIESTNEKQRKNIMNQIFFQKVVTYGIVSVWVSVYVCVCVCVCACLPGC